MAVIFMFFRRFDFFKFGEFFFAEFLADSSGDLYDLNHICTHGTGDNG